MVRPGSGLSHVDGSEEPASDLPGSLWHALIRLQHTHPDPVGRTGPLARPAGMLSFTAAADTILAARVHLSGAETMGDCTRHAAP